MDFMRPMETLAMVQEMQKVREFWSLQRQWVMLSPALCLRKDRVT